MNLGIPVYDGANLLDVAGPYELFNSVTVVLFDQKLAEGVQRITQYSPNHQARSIPKESQPCRVN